MQRCVLPEFGFQRVPAHQEISLRCKDADAGPPRKLLIVPESFQAAGIVSSDQHRC